MEKVFQIVNKAGITPNQLYVLWSIRDNVSPIGLNIPMELRLLGSEWFDGGALTGKALSLLIEIDEIFKGKNKSDVELMGPEFKQKIEEYRLIFPDKKLGSGKYARDNVKNLEVNFRWFFKNHKYDWDTVLKAATKYEAEYASKNHEFMRTSKYFIKKQDKDGSVSSDLANYCEMIVTGEGNADSEEFHFPEKVV